ncbi:MAG: hypothetical protein AAF401_16405, partial [Pseudomonadota bacterium]
MDDVTDPTVKAEEDRAQRKQRRRERQARRKMHKEMAAAAAAAAADHARDQGGDQVIDYASANPGRRDGDAGEVQQPAQQQGGGAAGATQALARIEPAQVARAPKPGALAETVPDDAFEIARAQRESRMKDIRKELRRRRRLRTIGIFFRFLLFVIGPTAFVGWYYYEKATDMYVSEASLVFKS